MLEYEWGNPSAMILSGGEANQDPGQNRQLLDHYGVESFENNAIAQSTETNLFHQQRPPPCAHQVNSLLDVPHPYGSGPSSFSTAYQSSLLSLEPVSTVAGTGQSYFVIPKTEESTVTRIGLNLGGRTYFSSAEDEFVNRLYRRPRAVEPGSSNGPKCQAKGCNADLTNSKHYHRRHKVCEFHSKASTVVAGGLTQRFCQQCSRFHLLSEFDQGKRSCRKRLADHNRRRRKSNQKNQENHKSKPENALISSSDNLARSPQESGANSCPLVTVGVVSPPAMTLDCSKRKMTEIKWRRN